MFYIDPEGFKNLQGLLVNIGMVSNTFIPLFIPVLNVYICSILFA